jgi:toxin-antitoxin system PIN domain toxin
VSRSLLDANVLLALLDADHVDHARSWSWWDAAAGEGWASCAITENGFVRILSRPRYPSPVPPAEAVALLQAAASGGDHVFWPCDLSVLDADRIDASRLHGARQLTDAYLLALAVAHRGRLVTFDRRVALSAVRGAHEEHLLVL